MKAARGRQSLLCSRARRFGTSIKSFGRTRASRLGFITIIRDNRDIFAIAVPSHRDRSKGGELKSEKRKRTVPSFSVLSSRSRRDRHDIGLVYAPRCYITVNRCLSLDHARVHRNARPLVVLFSLFFFFFCFNPTAALTRAAHNRGNPVTISDDRYENSYVRTAFGQRAI